MADSLIWPLLLRGQPAPGGPLIARAYESGVPLLLLRGNDGALLASVDGTGRIRALNFGKALTADPSTPSAGDVWYRTDTNRLRWYDGTAVRTIAINVEDGATADQTAPEIEAIVNHDNLLGFVLAEHIDWAVTGPESIHTDRYIEGGPGTDGTAIHDDTAAEISAIAEKVTPVAADLLVIEDSAAANVKKRVQVGNLPGGGGGDTHPVVDTTSLVKDPADGTKQARIDVGAVATGTVRVLTMPDQDIDLAPGTGAFATEAEGTLAASAMQDLIDDVTPQLGGNLDANGKTIDGRVVATDGAKLDTIEASAAAPPYVEADLANNAVTNAKLADVATQTIKGRTTAATGDPEDLTAAQARGVMSIDPTAKGDVLVATGASTPAFVPTEAGDQDKVLTADSAATNGVDWAYLHIPTIAITTDDSGTNYNLAAFTAISWTGAGSHFYYDAAETFFQHSTTVNPTRITIQKDGLYEIHVNLALQSTLQRANLDLKVRKNGTTDLVGRGSMGYIRALSNHNWSSIVLTTWSELNATDYVEAMVMREAAIGVVNLRSVECIFSVKRIGNKL